MGERQVAEPGVATTRAAKSGSAGGWFWLAAPFAAAVVLSAESAHREMVLARMLENGVAVVAVLIFWSVAGRMLGRLLQAAAPAPVPAWAFRLSGWSLVSLGGGVLLGLMAGADPRGLGAPAALFEGLLLFAGVGLAWTLLLDLPRLLLWRLSGTPAMGMVSVASIAVVGGMIGIAVLTVRFIEGAGEDRLFQSGAGMLALVLAAGVVLTLAIALPRALLLRATRRPGERANAGLGPQGHKPVGRILRRASELAGPPGEPPAPVAAHKRARSEHGSIATPPTVVRRR